MRRHGLSPTCVTYYFVTFGQLLNPLDIEVHFHHLKNRDNIRHNVMMYYILIAKMIMCSTNVSCFIIVFQNCLGIPRNIFWTYLKIPYCGVLGD